MNTNGNVNCILSQTSGQISNKKAESVMGQKQCKNLDSSKRRWGIEGRKDI
jgi:hypothetical protein